MSPAARAGDPNLENLTLIVRALGDLCDSLVFVGGCATGLLVTTVRANVIRVTEDVDVIAQAATMHEYHAMEAAVQARGFAHDASQGVPICRWIKAGIKLDLMPSAPGILGFHNRWYPLAMQSARSVMLPDGSRIRLVDAPAFLATKLEAFRGRGRGDYLASHDLEDIVTVIDGRPGLHGEVLAAPAELRRYLGEELTRLLASDDFVSALAGHLPGDAASQNRLPEIMRRLRAIAALV